MSIGCFGGVLEMRLDRAPTAAEVVEHLPAAEEILGRRTIACIDKSLPGYDFKVLFERAAAAKHTRHLSTEIKKYLCCT